MQEQVPLRQQQINSDPEKVKFILKTAAGAAAGTRGNWRHFHKCRNWRHFPTLGICTNNMEFLRNCAAQLRDNARHFVVRKWYSSIQHMIADYQALPAAKFEFRNRIKFIHSNDIIKTAHKTTNRPQQVKRKGLLHVHQHDARQTDPDDVHGEECSANYTPDTCNHINSS